MDSSVDRYAGSVLRKYHIKLCKNKDTLVRSHCNPPLLNTPL